MNSRLFVIDNFFSQPEAVRAEAFALEYDQPHPDYRWYVAKSPSRFHAEAVAAFESVMREPLLDHESYAEQSTVGRFQFSLAEAAPLISLHTDPYMWAGMIYLTPDAPIHSGTRFYRHKASGRHGREPTADRADLLATQPLDTSYVLDGFEVAMEIGNIFNRAVLFDGTLYHAAAGYFGDEPANARLTQTFFFNLASDGATGG